MEKVYVVMESYFDTCDWESHDSKVAAIKKTPEAATSYINKKAEGRELAEDKVLIVAGVKTRKIRYYVNTEDGKYSFSYWVEEHIVEQ